jgi:Na+/H+ antiporter NhaA
MATDTAFAVAVIAMMGSRVPVELRIFLTAAAIVDDIGAIVVVAGFYSGELYLGYLSAAVVIAASLAPLNHSRSIEFGPTFCLASCCGLAFAPAVCTRRWRVSSWRSSSRHGHLQTFER